MDKITGSLIHTDSKLANICCHICFIEFDSTRFLPKVLDCGHTICVECLKSLLETTAKCSKCRQDLSQKAFSKYPTNFDLLELCSSFGDLSQQQTQIKDDVESLKSRTVTCIITTKKVLKDCNEFMPSLEATLSQLEELDKMSDERNVRNVNDLLAEKKRLLEIVENRVCGPNLKPETSPQFRNFVDSQKFLYEIYQTIENGGSIFTFQYIQNKIKYGRISVWSNLLIFHSLGLSQPPDNHSDFIQFENLKKTTSLKGLRAFLKVSGNEQKTNHIVLIEMANSPLASQFIKLCTGELGPSYKGASLIRGEDETSSIKSLMMVPKYNSVGDEISGSVDYAFEPDTEVYYPSNTTVVRGWCDGRFQMLVSSSKNSYKSVIGKVDCPPNLKELLSYDSVGLLKIIGCGLAFTL